MYGVKLRKIKLLKKTGRRSCLVLFPQLRFSAELCSQLMGSLVGCGGFYFLLSLDVLVFHVN